MDNVFKLSPEEKAENERYWLKDTNSAAEDASGEAGEGARRRWISGGGGDDFGGGGGDFGGEPGESPELEEHKQEHKHGGAQARRLLSHQQHKKVVESLNFK
jgi:hypothetical protein